MTRKSLLHVSLNRTRFKDKTCSNSKCYSVLCASEKTHGAVVATAIALLTLAGCMSSQSAQRNTAPPPPSSSGAGTTGTSGTPGGGGMGGGGAQGSGRPVIDGARSATV
ncbi:putative membrane protein YgcG [Ensifer sp. WSM1721]